MRWAEAALGMQWAVLPWGSLGQCPACHVRQAVGALSSDTVHPRGEALAEKDSQLSGRCVRLEVPGERGHSGGEVQQAVGLCGPHSEDGGLDWGLRR